MKSKSVLILLLLLLLFICIGKCEVNHKMVISEKTDNIKDIGSNLKELQLSQDNIEKIVNLLKKKSKDGTFDKNIDADQISQLLVEKDITVDLAGEQTIVLQPSNIIDLNENPIQKQQDLEHKIVLEHDPLSMLDQFQVINSNTQDRLSKKKKKNPKQTTSSSDQVKVEETEKEKEEQEVKETVQEPVPEGSTSDTAGSPTVVVPEEKKWPEGSEYVVDYTKVIELNSLNFDRVLAENEYVYTLFYAPWCGRSQSLMEEFRETRKLYNFTDSAPVLFTQLNCYEHTSIRDKQSIGGNPVIQLFRNKGAGSIFPRGGSYPDAQVTFLRRNTLPMVTMINTTKDLELFRTIVPYGIIGVFTHPHYEHSSEYQYFLKVQSKLPPNKMPIALISPQHSIDTDKFEKYLELPSKVRHTSLVLIKPQLGENVHVYRSTLKVSYILRWLMENYQPLVNELTPENLNRMTSDEKPSLVIFINVQEYATSTTVPYKPVSPDLLQVDMVASEYQNRMKFFFIDGLTYRDFKMRLGIQPTLETTSSPIAIIDIKNENHYIYDQSRPVTKDNLKEFIEKYLDGSLQAFQYSAPSNTSSSQTLSQPIQTLISKEFNEKIMKSNKNSLIYFNANWCGFSKTMDIYFETASKKLYELYTQNDLQIFDYNINENSLPNVIKAQVDGYPFIALFIANDIENPIAYNRSRDSSSIIHFVTNSIPLISNEKEFELDAIDKSEKEI
ncbi:hypothetical protein DLAC_06971 [Tieghemostelium lacteum]|uniref:Thioredoxin domain-containing protein n=1 Tax=Tieghemostelium lacteum TaxID=361077 RepID=A0A151ZDZ3_TIELA|nr:hypothetical protein DLAC_06971 [Tieghemostelium lacteum]|eukprot:KYQ92130.1 hypothetical protein DLAC_06971 [Tieghemostelium lacteum]